MKLIKRFLVLLGDLALALVVFGFLRKLRRQRETDRAGPAMAP